MRLASRLSNPPQLTMASCPAPSTYSRGVAAPSASCVASLYRTTLGVPILTCPRIGASASKMRYLRGCERESVTDARTCTANNLPVVIRRKDKSAPFKTLHERKVATVYTTQRVQSCGRCSGPTQVAEGAVLPDSSKQIPITTSGFGEATQPAAYRIFSEKEGPLLCRAAATRLGP